MKKGRKTAWVLESLIHLLLPSPLQWSEMLYETVSLSLSWGRGRIKQFSVAIDFFLLQQQGSSSGPRNDVASQCDTCEWGHMLNVRGAAGLLASGCERARVRTVVLKGDPVNEVWLEALSGPMAASCYLMGNWEMREAFSSISGISIPSQAQGGVPKLCFILFTEFQWQTCFPGFYSKSWSCWSRLTLLANLLVLWQIESQHIHQPARLIWNCSGCKFHQILSVLGFPTGIRGNCIFAAIRAFAQVLCSCGITGRVLNE